jgi:hypothetical protein
MTVLVILAPTYAQKHEIAFVSGVLRTGEHQFEFPSPGFVRTGTDFTYQVSYAHRFFDGKIAALYFEFPLAVTPKKEFRTTNVVFPKSYSSIFFTPGIKLKLVPGFRYSPYVVGGAGLARLSPSDQRIDGQPTSEDEPKTKGAYAIGGGIDVKIFPYLSLRGEVRDYYSATPEFSVNLFKDRQHNFMYSAGLVLRF